MSPDVEGAEIEALGGPRGYCTAQKGSGGGLPLAGRKPHLASGREVPEKAGFQDKGNRRWRGPCLESIAGERRLRQIE